MTQGDCEHTALADDGRCMDCGDQIVLTGQVPVQALDGEFLETGSQ